MIKQVDNKEIKTERNRLKDNIFTTYEKTRNFKKFFKKKKWGI